MPTKQGEIQLTIKYGGPGFQRKERYRATSSKWEESPKREKLRRRIRFQVALQGDEI